ncbi:hypothetical protein E6C60_0735 [Paenibacillus algicola]|uniref:Uncharacterized protein n=1 Tax=Paenibacillus algicola TaxID=2565926 RepID=A0A4P8XG97_9BACL|nr:hypothetical protein E6C60_0735 [Paenibacillus algicola]
MHIGIMRMRQHYSIKRRPYAYAGVIAIQRPAFPCHFGLGRNRLLEAVLSTQAAGSRGQGELA